MNQESLTPSPEEVEQFEQEKREQERQDLEFEQEMLVWEQEEQELKRQHDLELAEMLEWEKQEGQFEKDWEFTKEAKREHVSPDVHTGLGKWAVEQNIETPVLVTDDQDMDEYWEQNIHPELEEVRDHLGSLNEDQRKHINELISGRRASAWLDQKLGISEETEIKPYIETLLAKDEKGNNVVGDRLFMNFLELHNKILAEEQEKLTALDDEAKANYEADIRAAVEEGLVQKSVLKRVELLLPYTKLIADDGFNTSVNGVSGSARSAIEFDGIREDEVRVAPAYIKDPKKLERLLQHEFSHTVQGEDEVEDEEFAELPAGGMERIVDGPGETVLNEAVVEQFAESLAKGEPDETAPKSDIRKGAMYPAPRKLLHVLANKGAKNIDIRDFFKAHFESSGEAAEAGDDSFRQRLIEGLDEAFPFTDVRKEIAELNIRDDKGIEDYAERLQERAEEYQASLIKN